jgi:hypothetical protein
MFVWATILHKSIKIVPSTTRQESLGRFEVKNWMWNVILTKTWKINQVFFTVFPAIMFRFELRTNFFNQNDFFYQELLYLKF